MRYFAVTLLALLISLPAYAADTSVAAGFPPGSLWLSKTALKDGDTTTVFTVLYNSSDASLTGDAIFLVDTTELARKHFVLDVGTTEVESVSWTAVTGMHTLSARIENVTNSSTKAKTTIQSTAAGTVSVTVLAPPPPPPPVVIASSTPVGGVVPIIENAGKTIYAAAEDARKSGAAALAIALAPVKETTHGSVLSAETENRVPSAQNESFFQKFWKGFLSLLLFIFQTQTLFYLVLAVVLYLLYKLARVFFAERRRA